MDDLGKTAHKVFKIKYHFVFCIKYRKDLFLNEKYVETVKNVCRGLEERYSMKFETIGFDEDHVHFLLQAVPRYSPSQVFRVVKSITAIQLFEKHPDLRKELWGGEFWSDGVLLVRWEKELMPISSEITSRSKGEKEIS